MFQESDLFPSSGINYNYTYYSHFNSNSSGDGWDQSWSLLNTTLVS